MARTIQRNPESRRILSVTSRQKLRSVLRATGRNDANGSGSATLIQTGVGPPTQRSASLLLSFPFTVAAEIFRLVLEDCLRAAATQARHYDYIPFSLLVSKTIPLRSTCRAWASHVRAALFARRGYRGGILALVKLYDLPILEKTFPFLDHCVLDLRKPFDLEAQEAALEYLRSFKESSSLSLIRAIKWNFGALHRYDAAARLVTRYLQDPRMPSAGAEYPPPLDELGISAADFVDQLALLHHYNMHVLRIILGRFSVAEYLEIPSSMLFALLGGVNHRILQSQIREKLPISETLNDGNSILSIIQNAQYVRFVGPSNPFLETTPPWVREETIITPAVCGVFDRAIERSTLPDTSHGPSQGISLSDANTGNSRCGDDKWLRFLQQFRENGGITKSLHISETSNELFEILARTNTSVFEDSSVLHTTHNSYPRIHLCEELHERNLTKTDNLELSVDSICPELFKNVPRAVSGTWRIFSPPRLCPQWFSQIGSRPSGESEVGYDLALIQSLIDAARQVAPNLDISIVLAFETFRFPIGDVKALEILPAQRKMSYRCFGVPSKAFGQGRNFARDFMEEEFHAAVRQLIPQRPGFGLFNILDELAGIDPARIRFGMRG